MHPHLRAAHEAPLRATGKVSVTNSSRPMARLFARLLRLPRPGIDLDLAVTVTETPDGQQWDRRFGSQRLRTYQHSRGGMMVELSGPGAIFLVVEGEGENLVYRSAKATFGGIRVPRGLAPTVVARAIPTETGWVAQVEISIPVAGQLCSYRAEITQWT